MKQITNYLKQVINKNFDPHKMIEIFTSAKFPEYGEGGKVDCLLFSDALKSIDEMLKNKQITAAMAIELKNKIDRRLDNYCRQCLDCNGFCTSVDCDSFSCEEIGSIAA